MSVVRGWCPTAHRPMAAGDGLLVRVRPRLGRLTRPQTLGLCAAALAYGNGEIDLTNRANLQIRGVGDAHWASLIAALCALDLIDSDPMTEGRRMLLVTPDWRTGDDTHRIASELIARLGELPELPGKFGFAVDAGEAPVLRDDPADIRLERTASGGLMVRADGRATGASLSPGSEVDAVMALAHWFVASGGILAGRMARHAAPPPAWADQGDGPARAAPILQTGDHRLGAVHGLPFGRIEAQALANLVTSEAATAIRLTPWRRLIVEGGISGGAVDPATLYADACVGAPACPQASIVTRAIAQRIAPFVAGHLHVSGCDKGCARSQQADVVLTGREGRFDLAFHARAGDPPMLSGLDETRIIAYFGAA